MPKTNGAWICVQTADLLRRAEEAILQAMTALGLEIHAAMSEDTYRAFSTAAPGEVKDKIAEAADLCEQLAELGQGLPDDVEVTYDDVQDGAAAALAEGILDPHTALLAARVLSTTTGWAALAQALQAAEVRTTWNDITPEQVLSRFRGADRRHVGRVIRDAGLSPESTFSDCSPDELQRLAETIERHAKPQPS